MKLLTPRSSSKTNSHATCHTRVLQVVENTAKPRVTRTIIILQILRILLTAPSLQPRLVSHDAPPQSFTTDTHHERMYAYKGAHVCHAACAATLCTSKYMQPRTSPSVPHSASPKTSPKCAAGSCSLAKSCGLSQPKGK